MQVRHNTLGIVGKLVAEDTARPGHVWVRFKAHTLKGAHRTFSARCRSIPLDQLTRVRLCWIAFGDVETGQVYRVQRTETETQERHYPQPSAMLPGFFEPYAYGRGATLAEARARCLAALEASA